MDESKPLNHTRYECKYHVVFIPKYRKKQLYGELRIVGYIKGKSAIHLARVYMGRKRNFVGQSFWARGYYVSTVGRDEEVVRDYIRNQEVKDQRIDQMDLLR